MPCGQGGGLTILTNEEPVAEPTLEVIECGVTHEVAVLAILGRPEGPTSANKRIVVHGDDTHDGGE
jgi:hypothetical protein